MAIEQDEDSAIEIKCRVCKAAPLSGWRRATVSWETERRRRRDKEEMGWEYIKAQSDNHFLEGAHLRSQGEEPELHPGVASGETGRGGVTKHH